MKPILVASIAIFLVGCQTLPPTPDIPTVTQVPVLVPCLDERDVPPRPAFVTDKELSAMDDGRLVLSIRKDQLDRKAYEGKLEAVVLGCVGKTGEK